MGVIDMKHLFLCSLSLLLWALFLNGGMATSVDPVPDTPDVAPHIDEEFTLTPKKPAKSWSFQSPVEKWATSVFGDETEGVSNTPVMEPQDGPQLNPTLPMDLFLPAGVTVDPHFSEP